MRRRSFLVSSAALLVAPRAHAVEAIDAARVVERVRREQNAVLVHVWATWCGACKKVYPDVSEVAADYGAKGLAVLAFAIDDDRDVVERYEAAHPSRWTGLHVPGGRGLPAAIAELGGRFFGMIPYDLLLDERGAVVEQWAGGRGRERLRAIVESGLPDTPVAAPVAPVEQGRVHIVLAGREGDPVSIDGWNAGVLPLDTELVAGPHVFRVDGPAGRVQVELHVVLEAGRVAEIDLAAAPSPVTLE